MPLTVDVFDSYGPPFIPRPRARLSPPANLQIRKNSLSFAPFAFGIGGIMLLVPAGSDIRPDSGFLPGPGDTIEAPQGSGRFYKALVVEDIAKGFLNEYRVVVLEQLAYVGELPIT